MVTRAAAVAGYRRALVARGEPVTFVRINGDAPNTESFSASVTAIVMGNSPTTSIGGFAGDDAITEGDRKIIVLNDDLAAARFPLPLQKNDKVIVQGEEMNIERVDPSTRGIAGAWDVIAMGVR
jgi:hypothetical protein